MAEHIVSAPGKILIIGGYSILEKGNVAYTVGINKRVFVKTSLRNGIEFNLPQFKIKAFADFEDGKIVYTSLLDDSSKEKLAFVKNATELTMRYLKENGDVLSGVKIVTANEPDFTYRWGASKAGFGSSAAVTVATVGALFSLAGRDIGSRQERERINKLAQTAHYLSQGKVGSGFDISTAVFGSHVYMRFSEDILKNSSLIDISELVDREWDYFVEPLDFPDIETAIAFTGKASSTKDMVKKINEFKTASAEEYATIMDDLKRANEKAVNSLKKYVSQSSEKNLMAFGADINETRLLLKKLGELSGAHIETPELTRLLDAALDAGAFAVKLPGAGGGDSVVALCKDRETAENVYGAWRDLGIMPLPNVKIGRGSIGVREETVIKFDEVMASISQS